LRHPATARQTKIVRRLGLDFEPSLIVTDQGGTVVRRLDHIFDRRELSEALDTARG